MNKNYLNTHSSTWSIIAFIFYHRGSRRLLIVTISFLATLLGLMAPIFQKEFIDHLIGQVSFLGGFSTLFINPFWWLVIGFISFAGGITLTMLTNYLGTKEGLIAQGNISSSLYQKTLSLRAESLSGKNIGELIATYGTDIPGATVLLDQTLPIGVGILFPLILAPLIIGYMLHLPSWPLYVLIFTMIVLNLMLAARHSSFFFLLQR